MTDGRRWWLGIIYEKMSRSASNKIVREQTEHLYGLLQRHAGTGNDLRIRMLLLFAEKPAAAFNEASQVLGVGEKTVRRWWALYHRHGIDRLLDVRSYGLRMEEDGWGYAPLSIGTDIRDPATTLLYRFIDFLDAIPVTIDTRQFAERLRNGLMAFFDDVDYAVLNVRVTVDVFNPASNMLGAVRRNHIVHGGMPAAYESVAPVEARPIWRHMYEAAREHMPHLGAFGSPIGFDYFFRTGQTFVGCLMVFRSSEKPPISPRTVAILDRLQPFLTNALVHHIAFRRQAPPSHPVFGDVFSILDPDGMLTGQEREVIRLAIDGYSNGMIAESIGLEADAVALHFRSVLRKLNVRSFREMVSRIFSSTGQSFPDDADKN